MRRRKLNDDPDIAARQIACQLAEDSIVTQALSRYLFQIMEFVSEEFIKPLRRENAELKARIVELENRA